MVYGSRSCGRRCAMQTASRPIAWSTSRVDDAWGARAGRGRVRSPALRAERTLGAAAGPCALPRRHRRLRPGAAARAALPVRRRLRRRDPRRRAPSLPPRQRQPARRARRTRRRPPADVRRRLDHHRQLRRPCSRRLRAARGPAVALGRFLPSHGARRATAPRDRPASPGGRPHRHRPRCAPRHDTHRRHPRLAEIGATVQSPHAIRAPRRRR